MPKKRRLNSKKPAVNNKQKDVNKILLREVNGAKIYLIFEK